MRDFTVYRQSCEIHAQADKSQDCFAESSYILGWKYWSGTRSKVFLIALKVKKNPKPSTWVAPGDSLAALCSTDHCQRLLWNRSSAISKPLHFAVSSSSTWPQSLYCCRSLLLHWYTVQMVYTSEPDSASFRFFSLNFFFFISYSSKLMHFHSHSVCSFYASHSALSYSSKNLVLSDWHKFNRSEVLSRQLSWVIGVTITR